MNYSQKVIKKNKVADIDFVSIKYFFDCCKDDQYELSIKKWGSEKSREALAFHWITMRELWKHLSYQYSPEILSKWLLMEFKFIQVEKYPDGTEKETPRSISLNKKGRLNFDEMTEFMNLYKPFLWERFEFNIPDSEKYKKEKGL